MEQIGRAVISYLTSPIPHQILDLKYSTSVTCFDLLTFFMSFPFAKCVKLAIRLLNVKIGAKIRGC